MLNMTDTRLPVRAHGLSDTGCVRKNNEDAFTLVPEAGLFIVADGVGGASSGEVAAQIAVQSVAEHMRNTPRRDGAALTNAITEAHNRVMSAGQDPERTGMACTLVAALVNGSELILAHVGDSRAYVFLDARIDFVTGDHTWVNEVGRKLDLSEAVLSMHPYRHVVTMAVGAPGPFKVDLDAVPLAPGMRVLLCTDGLTDVVPDPLILAVAVGGETIESRAMSLITLATAAGAPDNVTVVLVDCEM